MRSVRASSAVLFIWRGHGWFSPTAIGGFSHFFQAVQLVDICKTARHFLPHHGIPTAAIEFRPQGTFMAVDCKQNRFVIEVFQEVMQKP
jgi:hypothetical protein